MATADDNRAALLTQFLTSRPSDGTFQTAIRNIVNSPYLTDGVCGPGRCCDNCTESIGPNITGIGIKAAGGIAAPFTFGLSAVFSSIFGPLLGIHSAHLAQDRQIFCPALKQTNDALQQLDAAVSAGKVDVATATNYLDQLYSQFSEAMSGLHSGCTGNMFKELLTYAITLRKQVEYQSGGRFAPSGLSALGAGGIGTAALIIGGALVLKKLLL